MKRGRRPSGRRPNGLAFLALALVSWLAASGPAAGAEVGAAGASPRFKVRVRDEGVYRLRFEDLQAAGLTASELPSANLGLSCQDEAVPIRVDDGGDGRFGPGDALVFVGHHLTGESTYFNPYSDLNVYWLAVDATAPARFRELADVAAASEPAAELTTLSHLENDTLLLRLARNEGASADLWYWAKLNSTDTEPFALPLDLAARRLDSALPVRLRVALRGWSWQRPNQRGEVADHRVEVALNGVALAAAEWNDQKQQVIDLPAVPPAALKPTGNVLTLKVPKRRRADGAEDLIDVVVLDWVEVEMPREGRVDGQLRLRVPEGQTGRAFLLTSGDGRELSLFGGAGSLLHAEHGPAGQRFTVPEGEQELWAVAGDELLAPVGVELDRPSHLRDTAQQADYLIITHPSLAAAVAPLAEFHRSRGLRVLEASVDDIYDEFTAGITSPVAIRQFVKFAYSSWQRPALRFVLLVGDASWDPKSLQPDDRNYVDWAYGPNDGTRFRKNRSTAYGPETQLAGRNLVPTWTFFSYQGHAASDNDYARVEGEDVYPDIAIGRFPVVSPAEVSAIVAKTIRYAREADLGRWRQRVLWITNDQRSLQQNSDRMAGELAGRGIESARIYPSPEVPNLQHQKDLRAAFDAGYEVVHFHGHGGRYIWRTGAADLKKNHDLFTLADLDQLAPTNRLAIVLSMTCYSAPFDHPTADSIGEKFLRLPDRGAVAVVAASWRNSPLPAFSEALVDAMLTAPTVGEALVRAKRKAQVVPLIELYNLLGDPAVPIAHPAGELAVELAASEDGNRSLRAHLVDGAWSGHAQVDFLGPVGEVLLSRTVDLGPGGCELAWPAELPQQGAVRAVAVYAWNEGQRLDAAGTLELEEIPPPSSLEELPPAQLDDLGP